MMLTLPFVFVLSLLSGVSRAQEIGTSAPALTNHKLRDFHNELLNRINAFVNYVGVIADKYRSFEERNDAIQTAMLLFRKGATVGLATRTGTVKTYGLRAYLETVNSLPSSQVTVIGRCGNWERQPDGSYRARGFCFEERNMNPTRALQNIPSFEAYLAVGNNPFYNERQWQVQLSRITLSSR